MENLMKYVSEGAGMNQVKKNLYRYVSFVVCIILGMAWLTVSTMQANAAQVSAENKDASTEVV